MPPTRNAGFRRTDHRSHAIPLVALLIGTLVLATMLAYEAHDAARSHRVTAERALHDYAEVAAWELVAATGEDLQSSLGAAFAPMTKTRASSPYELLPAPSVLANGADKVLRCTNAEADSARLYFRFDFRDSSLAIAGGPVSESLRTWLGDTIQAHGRTVYQPDWGYGVIFDGSRGGSASALVYSIKFTEHGAPLAAYGIRTCADVVGARLIRNVIAQHPLLPMSVAGAMPNDSIVGILVRDDRGHTVFQSAAGSPSPYSASVTLKQLGELTAQATILPRAVEVLALGALPSSRIPILVGLLTLTAAMVAVTIMQLRREHELARLRADFISSVSHELRTPLSQILLFAETLKLGRVRSEQERHSATDVIVQEGRRLMHLVENILHFSRAERQMTWLGLEPVDLSAELQTIVDDWRPLAGAADVRIETRLSSDVHAMADRAALRQMVLNLLDNAVKYGPAAQTVVVGTSIAGEHTRAWVEDQGQGIPLRDRERVWTAFYRLDRDANSAVAGSGIGLYVVRELARLHEGDAWIEDAPGGGARFVVELRAAARLIGLTGEHPSVASTTSPTATADRLS